jgi:tRNA threonylcarbamoyl adenosine modification protein (Sua5/YciO/YrdC/YwlC family)
MLIRIHPDNPSPKHIQQVAGILSKGGIIIYPTDTVYGMGCSINNSKALQKVCTLKNINPKKANLSIICHDLSHISDYIKPIDTATFRLLKQALPGPYTFILPANNQVSKLLGQNKSTVGIRVPDNLIIRTIVQELGHPILSTSIHDEDDMMEYTTDPELIHEKYSHEVDAVIDGGYGGLVASTVIDCSNGEPIVVREGLGDINII